MHKWQTKARKNYSWIRGKNIRHQCTNDKRMLERIIREFVAKKYPPLMHEWKTKAWKGYSWIRG